MGSSATAKAKTSALPPSLPTPSALPPSLPMPPAHSGAARPAVPPHHTGRGWSLSITGRMFLPLHTCCPPSLTPLPLLRDLTWGDPPLLDSGDKAGPSQHRPAESASLCVSRHSMGLLSPPGRHTTVGEAGEAGEVGEAGEAGEAEALGEDRVSSWWTLLHCFSRTCCNVLPAGMYKVSVSTRFHIFIDVWSL